MWLEPNKIVYVFFLTIGLVLVGLAGAFGGFATFDNVISQAYARNQLAITNEFKRDVGYVVELQITKPTNAQIGHVGTQNSGAVGGGGNQLNFLITGGERASTFQYVNGSGRVLP